MYDKNFRRLMTEMYRFNFRLSLIHRVTGESPARLFELPLAALNLGLTVAPNKIKLLDVGCGSSCFPLWIAKKGISVDCLDISESVMVQKKYAQKVGIINHPIPERFSLIDRPKGRISETSYSTEDGKFTVRVCDARKLDYPDQSFDAVSCISAIEHIPNDGDTPAIKEIARVLKTAGRTFVSVPYAQQYREGRSHGGHFERAYNFQALQERLVEPSGLHLEREGFIFDKTSRRVTGVIYYKLPGYTRYLLGWSGILLLVSKALSHRDKANKNDAQFAWILLTKVER